MRTITTSDAAKAVVRRNTEEVQGKGRFDIFEELFADDFVDHTPQPNMTPDKAGVRKLFGYIRHAFPDFHPKIHWQLADGDRVITYRHTTEHMKEISSASLQPTAKFTSRPST
jgi:predicted SnoaL-like aldol condensation-catalyzing enzyme